MSLSNIGIDAFLVIAHTGTIVKAAAEMSITQTALTQRIKLLEQELETPLFIRSRQGMTLTTEGKLFLKHATEFRRLEVETIRKLKGSSQVEPRRIRITGPTLQTESRILPVLKDIKKSNPETFFTINTDDSEDIMTGLISGNADFVLTTKSPPPSIKRKKLTSSEFVIVGPYSWKNRTLKDIIDSESIVDFNEKDTYTIDFLKTAGIVPKHIPERHFINNTHQMLLMVQKGLGYAVFDHLHVRERLNSSKLINLAPRLKQKTDWYLCWINTGATQIPVMKRFIDLVI
jgi:LysR family transcriptional regulator, chromosome initiation inhibitor